MNEITEKDAYDSWLELFYINADFGPAHSDVMEYYYERFREETGLKVVQVEIDYGWEDE